MLATFAQAMSSTRPDRGEQHRARRLQVAVEHRMEAHARRRAARVAVDLLVGDGIVLAEPREDRVDLRARLLDGSALGQSALDEQPPRGRGVRMRVWPGSLSALAWTPEKTEAVHHHHRHPEFRLEMPGIVPVNPAGATPTTVYVEPESSTAWPTMSVAPAEAALPEPVAEHDHGRCAFGATFSSARKPRPSGGRGCRGASK